MGVIAFLDRSRRRAGLDDLTPNRAVVAVENVDPLAPHHRPVTLVEISDALGPGCDRKRIRPEVILPFAVADRERRAHARADDEVGMVAEQDGDGESTDQPW